MQIKYTAVEMLYMTTHVYATKSKFKSRIPDQSLRYTCKWDIRHGSEAFGGGDIPAKLVPITITITLKTTGKLGIFCSKINSPSITNATVVLRRVVYIGLHSSECPEKAGQFFFFS